MPSFNWKYEISGATPTVVIVSRPQTAMNWMAENNIPGNWRTYFTERTNEPPNWPIIPGILTLAAPSGSQQVLTQGTSDEAIAWLNDNTDQVPWDTNFTVQWFPPQIG